MKIDARAPTRIDLAGGTLDIWPLYLFHEGAMTVNCAITRYARCAIDVHPRRKKIELVSRDTHRSENFRSLEALARAKRYRLPLVAQLIRFFRPSQGFALSTDSEAPAGAGIGGSSEKAVNLSAAQDQQNGK